MICRRRRSWVVGMLIGSKSNEEDERYECLVFSVLWILGLRSPGPVNLSLIAILP